MELLPIEVFRLLQDFLGEKYRVSYSNLMNCNKKYFREVKYQTIHYKIKIDFSQGQSVIDRKLKWLIVLCNKVKDKSIQISLDICSVTEEQLVYYAKCFENIHSLSVIGTSMFNNQFDFSIFKNVYRLILYGFDGVKVLSKGPENVYELSLINFFKLSRIETTFKNLHKLDICFCSELKYFPNVDYPCVKVDRCNYISGLKLSPTLPYESLAFLSCGNLIIEPFLQLNTSFLQKVSLDNLTFPETDGHVDLAPLFGNIPDLYINASCDNEFFPQLSFFTGKILSLYNFDLMPWTKNPSPTMLPNLKEVHLFGCINFAPITNEIISAAPASGPVPSIGLPSVLRTFSSCRVVEITGNFDYIMKGLNH